MVISTVQVKDEKAASRVVKKLREKAIKTFLDTYVLSELQDKSLSGYDVLSSVRERVDFLISSGTVYCTLYSLERYGLVCAGWDGRKRMYSLTEKGRETAQVIAKNKEQIIQVIGEFFLNFKAQEAS